MKKIMISAAAAGCILLGAVSGSTVFAAGYSSTETNIIYQIGETRTNDGDTPEDYYTETDYSAIISNFSNGFSVVYEGCCEWENDFVNTKSADSSYVIDAGGNKVDIGDYDLIGTCGSLSVMPDPTFGNGIDMYGGVNVIKNEKFGYVSLRDGVKIPCEHDYIILRYDENIFGVTPDYYLGFAEYFIDASGQRILSDIDLTVKENYIPKLKYLGNNVFAYFYGHSQESGLLVKYYNADGSELTDYTPKAADDYELYYRFDDEALQNYYHYDYFEPYTSGIDSNGNSGLFVSYVNGKYGLVDKNANIIVPNVYDRISGLQDGCCWAAKNGEGWTLLQMSTDEVTVTVDNETVSFDQIPLIINGRTLAPLRAIFEKLGATVDWNGETKTITAVKNDTTITLQIDNSEMYKNGTAIALDTAPQIIGERTLVPVRAISEAFDCNVDWNNDTHTVIITQN